MGVDGIMGTMIERKKRLMMLTQEETYIKDGLVLWMDGIKKGNTAGAWVDQANGHIFTVVNDVIFGNSYVQTSATAYLTNTTFASPMVSVGTIEIVISDYVGSENPIVFMPNNSGIAFGIYDNKIIWSSGGTGAAYIFAPINSKIYSIHANRAFVDGIYTECGGGNSWVRNDSNNYIGRRSSGNQFSGKIHAIRLYNRQLTDDEILHNQRIDNKRFNLGLTI